MKVSVVGLGKVGSCLAFILSIRNFVDELVLVGRRPESVMGDVLDLRHGQLFVDAPAHIDGGSIEKTRGSDVVAICASAPTAPNMNSRLELAPANVALLQGLLPDIMRLSPDCKIVVVSNPVDVMVHFAIQITGVDPSRILGTGTLVDSARFRQLISDEVNIHMEDIRAYVLGEHGDSQFAAMSCADAGGEPLDITPARRELAQRASRAGYEVFGYKGYTNYAVALAAAEIIASIALDSRRTMPVSLKVDGFLGVDDVCLSLPAVIGENGVHRILHPSLNDDEKAAFLNCAEVVRQTILGIDSNDE